MVDLQMLKGRRTGITKQNFEYLWPNGKMPSSNIPQLFGVTFS